MVGDVMDNATIAHKLLGYAQVLQREQANLYRVRAYRKAAEVILAQERPLTELYASAGRAGLASLPGIGSHLAYTLEGLVTTGEFRVVYPPRMRRAVRELQDSGCRG